MGLINLKTNLKSLKYGKDRVGGGSSGQPFVQKPIPEDFSSVGQRYTNLVQARIDDTSRLTQLLISGKSTDGLLFSVKQNTLSRLGVQTQTSPRGLNEGAYLPTSTLAQSLIQGTGYHLNKQGLNPYPGGPGAIINYSDIVTYTQDPKDNRLVKYTNETVNKKSSNILDSYSGGPSAYAGIGTTNIYTAAFRTGINNTNNIVSGFRTVDILGEQQPGNVVEPFQKWTWSGLGLLRTPYKSYEFINSIPKGGLTANQKDSLTGNNWYTGAATWTRQWTPDAVFTTGSLLGATAQEGLNFDFIPGTFNTSNLVTLKTTPVGTKAAGVDESISSEYAKQNKLDKTLYRPATGPSTSQRLQIENNINFDVTSKPTEDLTFGGSNQEEVYYGSGSTVFDISKNGVETKITSSYGYTTEKNKFRAYLKNYTSDSVEQKVLLGNPASNRPSGSISYDQINALQIGETKTDLIDFKIQVIGGSTVQFRAFLDTITDSITSEWSGQQFTGRGEKFYTYSGYERRVSLGWTIAAQSEQELLPMYRRLNYLASAATPKYRSGFLQGNLLRLTIGNYLVNVPGKFDGLEITIDNNSTWDIDNKMPVVLKVSGFTFTPFHDFVPQIGQSYISFA